MRPGRMLLLALVLGSLWFSEATFLNQPPAAEASPTFEGLYAVTTNSGGQYHRLESGASNWTQESGTATTGASMLESFGDYLIYREGDGTGFGFRFSRDKGETWSSTAKPTDDMSYRPIAAELCSNGRLWLSFVKWSGTSTHLMRVYYSDTWGQTITLSKEMNFGGIGASTAHANGGLSCHLEDSNRVATITQRGSSCRLMVTTNGGEDWQAHAPCQLANAYQVIWAENRLVIISDIGSAVRISTSDDDGANWSNHDSSQSGTNRSSDTDVIRTDVPDLLFAYGSDAAVELYLLRSTDNGALQTTVTAGRTSARSLREPAP